MMWTVIAYVLDSPNTAPIAELNTRSVTLAYEVGKVFEKMGFRAEMTEHKRSYGCG
jgi:hypothetical protein